MSGLQLQAGGTYYVSVKARNAGGLWSEAGVPAVFLAESGVCRSNYSTLYLPAVKK